MRTRTSAGDNKKGCRFRSGDCWCHDLMQKSAKTAEVRYLGAKVPFASFAPSREVSVQGGNRVSREEREVAKDVYLLPTRTLSSRSPAEARVRPAITPTHPQVKVKWSTTVSGQ
ncbi:protein of unknown function [Methanoculleus bourgensis]|uniref:Uncharacterized protein n=1 Tax=Methanoculleus bourgensis TaxID=83986 RepID=A0A110BKD7_9EURY|nr:protein of unknown function [Methanoculleus bourgensis]